MTIEHVVMQSFWVFAFMARATMRSFQSAFVTGRSCWRAALLPRPLFHRSQHRLAVVFCRLRGLLSERRSLPPTPPCARLNVVGLTAVGLAEAAVRAHLVWQRLPPMMMASLHPAFKFR